jgi:hypothetical protein
MVNIAVTTPIPSASTRTVKTAKPGARWNCLIPKRTSCQNTRIKPDTRFKRRPPHCSNSMENGAPSGRILTGGVRACGLISVTSPTPDHRCCTCQLRMLSHHRTKVRILETLTRLLIPQSKLSDQLSLRLGWELSLRPKLMIADHASGTAPKI